MERNAFGIDDILYLNNGDICDPEQDPWDLDNMHVSIQLRLSNLVNLSLEEIRACAKDGFIDFNSLASQSSVRSKCEIRNISNLLVEAEIMGKTLIYVGTRYSIL